MRTTSTTPGRPSVRLTSVTLWCRTTDTPRGNVYDHRFWPAWYPIEADGFVSSKHFGEDAYDETEERIQQLPAEKDRIAG